jgi:hypothetical protein
MNVKFDINIDEVVKFTNKLEKLPNNALPAAIRGTLNDAAFMMKTKTMPKVAKAMFTERQPNFFKANSRFESAKGNNINTLASTVGFLSSGLHNQATNFAVKDLEQQEQGGTIKGRSFKPLEDARRGKRGLVKPNARISQILKAGKIIDVRDAKGANKMQQMIKSAIHAGEGGYIMTGSNGKGGALWRIKRVKRISGDTFFTKEKLYSFKKSGVAKVHATGFMKKAALEVQKEMEALFKIQAYRQIKKAMA